MTPEEKNILKQELLDSIFFHRQQKTKSDKTYSQDIIASSIYYFKSKKPEDQIFFCQSIAAANRLTPQKVKKYFVQQLQNKTITSSNFKAQYEIIGKELSQKLYNLDYLVRVEKLLTIELLKEKMRKLLKGSIIGASNFSTYDWHQPDKDSYHFLKTAKSAYPQINWDDLFSSTTLEVKMKLYKAMNPPDYHSKNEAINRMLFQLINENLQFSIRNGLITITTVSRHRETSLPSLSKLTKKSKLLSTVDNTEKKKRAGEKTLLSDRIKH